MKRVRHNTGKSHGVITNYWIERTGTFVNIKTPNGQRLFRMPLDWLWALGFYIEEED